MKSFGTTQLSDCESHNIGETCKGDDSCFWNGIWYWFDSFHWFTWFPYVIQSPSYASLCYGSQVVMFLEKEQKITSGRATWCFTSIQYVNNYYMSCLHVLYANCWIYTIICGVIWFSEVFLLQMYVLNANYLFHTKIF